MGDEDSFREGDRLTQVVPSSTAPPSPALQSYGRQSDSPWKIDEVAFRTLTAICAAHVPAHDCAICCQALAGDAHEWIALPCIEHGCQPFFHSRCVRPWLEQNPNCPLCRRTFDALVHPRYPPKHDSLREEVPLAPSEEFNEIMALVQTLNDESASFGTYSHP